MPVIGWMWYFLEIVFCKRKWEEDRTLVAQSLQKLRDYPENYWVGVFLFSKSAIYKLYGEMTPNLFVFELVPTVL